jgi:hypothetical protein
MLRRKPTLVKVRLEGKELEDARKRAAAAQFSAAPPSSPGSKPGDAAVFLSQFDSNTSLATRIGFNISNN